MPEDKKNPDLDPHRMPCPYSDVWGGYCGGFYPGKGRSKGRADEPHLSAGGKSGMPAVQIRLSGVRRRNDKTRKAFPIPVSLKPDKEYERGLNAEDHLALTSEAGDPLYPVVIRFKTINQKDS